MVLCMTVFISPQELYERIKSGKKQTVLDVSWQPEVGKAWQKFQSEHIPTAVFGDMEGHLVGMPGRREGRNPLPSLAVIDEALEEWGVEANRPVFIYDQGSGVFAARAWWIMRWAGLEHVHIIDGGFREWEAAGFKTIAGPGNVVVPRDLELEGNKLPVATLKDVQQFDGILIDARDEKRFAGRREVLDLKAGHIPSALNLPAADLFCKETRKIKETDYIRDRFASLGVTQNTDPAKVITYSGSGNHSALLIAAMEHAGLPVATHYVSGWSQWSARLGNKVATAL